MQIILTMIFFFFQALLSHSNVINFVRTLPASYTLCIKNKNPLNCLQNQKHIHESMFFRATEKIFIFFSLFLIRCRIPSGTREFIFTMNNRQNINFTLQSFSSSNFRGTSVHIFLSRFNCFNCGVDRNSNIFRYITLLLFHNSLVRHKGYAVKQFFFFF